MAPRKGLCPPKNFKKRKNKILPWNEVPIFVHPVGKCCVTGFLITYNESAWVKEVCDIFQNKKKIKCTFEQFLNS